MLACTLLATAQDILDVAPGTGTLNAAIKANGGNKIYRLQNGYNGYYVLDEIINNTGFKLTIIGGGTPDAGDPKPTMPPTVQTSGTGGVPFSYMFTAYDHITLRDIYFNNATADGVFNPQFFMLIGGNDVRVIIDNCVLDPAGSPIHCTGGSPKIYITNSLLNRLTNNTISVNGPVNFHFPNSDYGIDTLFVENNTFIGLSTAVFSDGLSAKSNVTWINHNTFLHHKCQIDWMANQVKFFFTNNLMYDCHVIPYEKAWVGGAWDNYPIGGVSELLWSAPDDSVKVGGVWEPFGYQYMTSFVANNIEFKNQQFIDNLDALYTWTKSKGAANSMYFQPLVWTPDAPARGIILDTALARNPQSKIYNNMAYPNWKAANNKYDINPTFTDHRIDSLSAILAAWALPATKNDYFASYYDGGTAFTSLNWYWDPDGKMGQNETWPLFDGTYTNSAALTGGLDGLPIGDLNWFSEKKVIWEKNAKAIKKHILSLNVEKMDLAALSDQDIVWDFEKDAQGWHDLGAGRDVTASWDNGSLKMTYFENSPGQGPQLWFAAVQVEYDEFDASKYPYLEIYYKPFNWPTTSPVKVLVTFTNSNNELVYSYATLDPTKDFVSIDIAAFDPTWGKPYVGKMKSVQLELPHNGDPASNPATGWFGAWTMIDKVVLTATKTGTGIDTKNAISESFSIYPNPASKSFYVSGTGADLISIYNASGGLIKKVIKTDRSISVEGFAKGLYFVRIESKGVTEIKKLIVK